jgi:hypothetical protein
VLLFKITRRFFRPRFGENLGLGFTFKSSVSPKYIAGTTNYINHNIDFWYRGLTPFAKKMLANKFNNIRLRY